MRIKAALIELSTFIWKRRRGEEEEEERGGEDEIEMEASWGGEGVGEEGIQEKMEDGYDLISPYICGILK